tara:strand:- start:25 stop:672 length:648 start_codon:yes stop_codon:yes gene_type:complete
MVPLTLAVATDHLLKNEFDGYREKQSSEHPIFEKFGLDVVPYQHPEIEAWRNNFKGIRYLHEPTNLEIFGAVDDVWQGLNSKELFIVDYKSTSKKGDPDIETGWGSSYKRQMEVYQWLFRQNGFPVSETGYFLYVNGIKGDNDFYSDHEGYEDVGFMEFKTTLIPYTGNSDWVSDILLRIKETLMDDKLPPANESWDDNRYFYERLQLERELGEI